MNESRRRRLRDLWQLDLPLVLALALCTTFTVIEGMRAADGVWRAWIYMFEWPLIGAFCVWIWVRFKREPGGGFARRWRERAQRFAEEPQGEIDPDLQAWQAYQRRVQDEQGSPPQA